MGLGIRRVLLGLAFTGATGLAIPVATAAASGASLAFRGTTSQHQRISIKLSPGHALLLLVYDDRFRCPVPARFPGGARWDGSWASRFDSRYWGQLVIPRSGHFKVDLTGNPAHSFHLSAVLTGKRITGSFTERGRISALTGNTKQTAWCTTGRVTFSAARP